MPTKRYSTEQIVSKLRQAEEELSRGLRTPAMCKKRGISEQTYYRWRTKRSTIRFSKRCLGKLLSPPRRRQAVALIRHRLGVSERRACRVLGQARSTHRHRARRPDDEPHGWWPGSSRWRRSLGGRAIGGLRSCCVGRAGR